MYISLIIRLLSYSGAKNTKNTCKTICLSLLIPHIFVKRNNMNKKRDINKMLILFRTEMIDKRIVRNKSEFADKLASDTSTLSKIEKGDRSVSLDMIIRLLTIFSEYITPNFLFGIENIEDNISLLVNASAGSSISTEFDNSITKFKIPGLSGKYIAFRVKGDSMTPTLENDDILICEEILNQSELENNKIYVVSSNDGVNVKRIKVLKKGNSIIGITLLSDNPHGNPPIEIDFSEGLYSSPFYNVYNPIRRITEKGLN